MLDDGDGRAASNSATQFEGGVGVVEVVVADSSLPCTCVAVAMPGRAAAVGVERRALVRVLAVAQRLPQRAGEARGAAGSPRRAAPANQPRDRGVVGGGAGIGGGGEAAAQRQRGRAAAGLDLRRSRAA